MTNVQRPEYFVAPDYKRKFCKQCYQSQTVRIGQLVETSAQGGWDDNFTFVEQSLEREIDRTFENVARALEPAETSWKDVWCVTSYHVGPISTSVVRQFSVQFQKRCPGGAPLWTRLEVKSLAEPEMRIAISVKACRQKEYREF